MPRSIRRIRHEQIRETIRRQQHHRSVLLPVIILHRAIEARPRQISRRMTRHRQQHQVVRLRPILPRSYITNRLPVRRNAHLPKWPEWLHELLHGSVRNLHAINSLCVLVRFRMLRSFHHNAVARRQPSKFIHFPASLGQRARLARRHVQNPKPRALGLLVHHARIILIFLLLLLFLCLRIRRQECNLLPVRRPLKRLHAPFPFRQRPPFPATGCHQENLLLLLRSIRKKRQLLAIRRPPRRQFRLRRKRKLPRRPARPVIHPNVPQPLRPLRRLRNYKRQPPPTCPERSRGVRRKLQVRHRPQVQRSLRRKHLFLPITRCTLAKSYRSRRQGNPSPGPSPAHNSNSPLHRKFAPPHIGRPPLYEPTQTESTAAAQPA